jgi:hypothetical protein
MLLYAVLRVLIVYSFSTATALLAQEIPGLLLVALVVVLIRRRVPRLRRIVDAEQTALAAEPILANAEPARAAHDRYRADADPGAVNNDHMRNSRV